MLINSRSYALFIFRWRLAGACRAYRQILIRRLTYTKGYLNYNAVRRTIRIYVEYLRVQAVILTKRLLAERVTLVLSYKYIGTLRGGRGRTSCMFVHLWQGSIFMPTPQYLTNKTKVLPASTDLLLPPIDNGPNTSTVLEIFGPPFPFSDSFMT